MSTSVLVARESENELDAPGGAFTDDRLVAQEENTEWEEFCSRDLDVSSCDVRPDAVPADVAGPIAPEDEEDGEQPDALEAATIRK